MDIDKNITSLRTPGKMRMKAMKSVKKRMKSVMVGTSPVTGVRLE